MPQHFSGAERKELSILNSIFIKRVFNETDKDIYRRKKIKSMCHQHIYNEIMATEMSLNRKERITEGAWEFKKKNSRTKDWVNVDVNITDYASPHEF